MQSQPRTVTLALLPAPVKIGLGLLRPVTIGGMAMLHAIKSPFVETGEPSSLDTFTAGYILSKPWDEIQIEHQEGVLGDNAISWAKTCGIDCDQLSLAIDEIITSGSSSAANVRMPSIDGSAIVGEAPNPDGNGIGYLLTIVEILCATYNGWTLEYVYSKPLITAYALIASHNVNEGAEWREPNYFERDRNLGDIKKYLDNMKF